MPRRRSGTVIVERFESKVLRGNPLRDPHVRRIPVYLPPSYPAAAPYPVVYLLTGFTGTGLMHLNYMPWVEPVNERVDRLLAARKMREAVVVMPDCSTRWGGSQYIDSSATGRYEAHLVREVVPWVDARFATVPHARGRAIVGKSSGGYGAIVHGMRHPDVFGAVACNSGDMFFEWCYAPAFPASASAFAERGGLVRWVRAWEREPKRGAARFAEPLNTLAMASCYSPNPRAPLGFDLPFDEETGRLRPEVWRRWQRWDPVHMLPRYARNLKRLRFLFLDCGARDQFNLQWGLRQFAAEARRLGVKCVVEEFPDDHSSVQYRLDRVLPLVVSKLARR